MSGTKAQLEFTADASGVEQGVAKAKRSLADLGATAVTEGKKAAAGIEAAGTGAKKAADAFNREEARLRASIQRTTFDLQTLGKTASEKFEAKISFQGLDSTKFLPYVAQLKALEQQQKAAEAALNSASPALDKVGMSAKATAAAMRGVPAQFTDIVTSIQGGQAPLTVLLQQGGQLKDMFGGIGPAARALGSYVAGLVNPFTIAAAASGVLALAYYQATERTTAFNKALVTSGNYAGQTAASLTALSEKIGGTIGSQSKAAEALNALASSGRFAGNVLEQVGAAVVAQNKLMGTSIEDAVAQYVKLADEPSKASAKLNESLNYLNQTTYERIKALEDQGNKEGAAALAQSTLASATLTRMQKVREESGYLAQALSFVTREAGDMWSRLSNSVGDIGKRPSVTQLREELKKAQTGPLSGSPFERKRVGQLEASIQAAEEIERLTRRSATDTAERAAMEKAAIAATDDVSKWQDKAKGVSAVTRELEKYRKRLDDIRKKNPNSEMLEPDAVKRGEDAIRKEFGGPKAPKEKSFQDDAATKLLATIEQQTASLSAQLQTSDKLTDGEKDRAKFVQEIADLKDKKVLTADQKSLLANKDQILAARDVQIALEKQVKTKADAAAADKKAVEDAKELARTFDGIALSMESASAGRREQYDRILSTAGLGTRARQETEAQREIFNEAQRSMRQATKAASEKPGGLDSDAYKDTVAKIKDSLDSGLSDLREFYAKDKANREDWVIGARQAFSNYSDEASNAAKHTEEVFGNALKGVEDQLTSLFTGGKFNAKKLFADLQADTTRNFIKENITGPLSDIAGKALGDGGALKSLFGSKGSSQLGATATNPLYVRLADSLGSLGSGASGSSGDGLLGLLGTAVGAFGGVGAQASVASALPGDALDNIFKLTGNFAKYSGGGYTGAGGKFDPAGIVHAGEYVITAESTKKLGVDFLDRLNSRGYANGGYVGAVMGGSLRQGGGQAEGPPVIVHQHFTVGDVASTSMVRQAVAGSEARIVGGLRRSRSHGGEAA